MSKEFSDLTLKYQEAEESDNGLWSEQRANCLMVIGDHYSRRSSQYWNRLRDQKQINESQRLRLTRNHVHRVCHKYEEGIGHFAPNVTIKPQNPSDIQDQKSAELNLSVLRYIQKEMGWSKRRKEAIRDFVRVGEVAWLLYYDDQGGYSIGNNPIPDPETGEVKNVPIMSGGIKIERIFGFNLLRPAGCESIDKAEWLCVRSMIPLPELKSMIEGLYANEPDKLEEKLKLVTDASKASYTVFEGQQGNYKATKGQALLKRFFFRACVKYPNGYYYYAVDNGIVTDGELPGGIFPIAYAGFDEVPTSPRHRSIIKQIRPIQIELNRLISKVAEHTITMGDDKVWLHEKTRVTPGATLPGQRVNFYTGAEPVITSGRAGDQFMPLLQNTLEELYSVANLPDELEDEAPATNDPMIAMYLSMRRRKKYANYGEKIIDFFVEASTIALRTMKHHVPEGTLIPMIGKDERVNVSEFKNGRDLCSQITVEESSDDPESQASRQMILNHFIQYAGGKLDKNDIGRIMKMSPFLNNEQIFEDYTLDVDSAMNDMLAMDRGEVTSIQYYDDHDYMLKRLIARVKKPDFKYLDPRIQQNYAQKIQAHMAVKADQAQKVMMAQKGFIPTSGYMAKVDMYVGDPANPLKTHRLEIPSDALSWLIKSLKEQGTMIQPMMDMPLGAQAQLAGQLSQTQQPQPANPEDIGAIKGSGPQSPGG